MAAINGDPLQGNAPTGGIGATANMSGFGGDQIRAIQAQQEQRAKDAASSRGVAFTGSGVTPYTGGSGQGFAANGGAPIEAPKSTTSSTGTTTPPPPPIQTNPPAPPPMPPAAPPVQGTPVPPTATPAPPPPPTATTLASSPLITGGPDTTSLADLQYGNAQTNTANATDRDIMGTTGVQAAYQTADGHTLQNDPSLQATMDAFNKYQSPLIQNQMALSGLGNSNATANALSLGQSQALAPVMEAALGREQQSLQTGSNAVQSEYGRRMSADQAASQANLATIPYLMQMSQNQTGNEQQQFNDAMQYGGLQQGVQQGQNDAAYQDFLRRQGLAEQATYGPFGQTIPSAFGSVSNTSKG